MISRPDLEFIKVTQKLRKIGVAPPGILIINVLISNIHTGFLITSLLLMSFFEIVTMIYYVFLL